MDPADGLVEAAVEVGDWLPTLVLWASGWDATRCRWSEFFPLGAINHPFVCVIPDLDTTYGASQNDLLSAYLAAGWVFYSLDCFFSSSAIKYFLILWSVVGLKYKLRKQPRLLGKRKQRTSLYEPVDYFYRKVSFFS